jgi:regulator of cell morphogenesis and NO signaling
MTSLTLENTVSEFVVDRPSRARLFERLGIDYCCGGKKSLAEACENKGLFPLQVLQTIEADEAPAESAIDPDKMGLAELADHIEQTHHARLKHELPRLGILTEKVARVHGESYTWAKELRKKFAALETEMTCHMEKEERVFFPMIRRLESGAPAGLGMQVSLEMPVQCLEAEHASVGRALEEMRSLSSDYAPPPGACNTTRAMLDGLAELEVDMHAHVHKENNIIFPKAVELGRRQAAAEKAATQGTMA